MVHKEHEEIFCFKPRIVLRFSLGQSLHSLETKQNKTASPKPPKKQNKKTLIYCYIVTVRMTVEFGLLHCSIRLVELQQG